MTPLQKQIREEFAKLRMDRNIALSSIDIKLIDDFILSKLQSQNEELVKKIKRSKKSYPCECKNCEYARKEGGEGIKIIPVEDVLTIIQ